MPAEKKLSVWMNGLRVGTWSHGGREGESFQYDDKWVSDPAARVLSLSLPFLPDNLPHRGAAVANYFDNLLPDSDTIRRRLRTRFKVGASDAFGLLEAIGRDCVGAIQLLPVGEAPTKVHEIEAEKLSDDAIEQLIDSMLSGASPFGHADDDVFRISIAGAQEKTALLLHDNKWCRPLGSTPSTHILKLPLGLVGNMRADMSESVENEWLCLRILKIFGLQVPDAKIGQFGKHKVLIVPRFDRAPQPSGWIARLPQEDFCQALGLPSVKKYESDGGPGMREILRILDTSSNAVADKKDFIKAQILFWLLAATDGHAKNFSIFHERGGTYRLTPFYDVVSAWPIIGQKPDQLDPHKARLAMAVRSRNAHCKLDEILPRHWDVVARSAGLGNASEIVQDILAALGVKIASVMGEAAEIKIPEKLKHRIIRQFEEKAKALYQL